MLAEDSGRALRGLIRSGRVPVAETIFSLPPPPAGLRPWDRVEGMLLGLAIGDALGNTSEGLLPSQRRERLGEIRDYLPNHHAGGRVVGLPSDDTQLAFWTLEQLIEDGGLVPQHLAERLAADRIFGIGSTVREFRSRLKDEHLPWDDAGVRSAGNGALMRIAPILIPHLRLPSRRLWTDTALATIITHNDVAAVAASVGFVTLLWDALAMTCLPEPEWWLNRFLRIADSLEPVGSTYRTRGGRYDGCSGRFVDVVGERVSDAWERRLDTLTACNEWYSGAYLLETMPSVLYILMCHGDDPEEAIVRAVNDTKDNDTIAAIVGAAVGALHGPAAFLSRWRSGLLGRTGEDDDGCVFELIERAQLLCAPTEL